MRWGVRLIAFCGVALALAVTAGAATGIDAHVTLERAGSTPVAGTPFSLVLAAEAPDATSAGFSFTLTTTLAAGLELIGIRGIFGAANCSTAGLTVTCAGRVLGGTVSGFSYQLRLKAARAGTYTVRSVLDVAGQTDPDPSNNRMEVAVAVTQAPVAVASFALVPSPPRARRALQATLLLSRGAVPVKAQKTVCRLVVSGLVVAGHPVGMPRGARCAWTLPASAKGKRVAGSITATAAGKTFTRRFSAMAA